MIFSENRFPLFRIMLYLFEHDLFGKPVPTFPDHALVVVHDLDFRRAFRRPDKAHAELVVDPDRVLPFAVARQRLKTVAWRRPQIAKIVREVTVTVHLIDISELTR